MIQKKEIVRIVRTISFLARLKSSKLVVKHLIIHSKNTENTVFSMIFRD